MNRPPSRRAGPLFGVVLVLVGLLGALSPMAPAARALDPTPEPSSSASPTTAPTPAPTTAPTAAPPPAPTAAPTAAPSAAPSTPPTPAPTAAPSAAPSTPPSPSASPEPSASPGADPGASPDPSAGPGASPDPSASPTPAAAGPRVAHAWVETVNARGKVIGRGGVDEPLTGAERFTVYRIRFQVVNDGETPVTLRPTLQVSSDSQAWATVPEVDPVAGRPFYAASDDGRVFKARRDVIAPQALRLDTSSDPLAAPVEGLSSAGRNPVARLVLPAHSYTEVEFAVRGTIDAAWLAEYRFRLLDDASVLDASAPAIVSMGAKPDVELSPGQRKGKRVDDPLPLYRLDPAIASTDLPIGGSPATAGLAAFGGFGAPIGGSAGAPGAFISPHTNYTLTTDACAACHASHAAQSTMLLQQPAPQATQCFTCHDGTGADADVQRDWTNPSLPANDPATSSWYSHPATTLSTHTSDRDDEFAGVLDRHATCADCHQPHNADPSVPVGTTGGWSASGAIKGAGGVAVVNGAAGTSPSYTLQATSTLEYELCFKCHSGFTQLPAQDPSHPSRWALDKAVELNPANVSYHPIEAEGKNQTNAMGLSLAGTSPYKLWRFETTSTIRCLNCHGDSELADPASPPAAEARLDNHAGPNRGILIAPYRDRDLLASSELYDARDFALCFACHAEEPMVDTSGDVRFDSNFNWHGFHVNSIFFKGTGGRDIDVDGDGQGNATCAECHFRTHGTTYAVDGQAPAPGLVNFAPNVQPYNGEIRFVPATSTTLGTCTLTCHGKPHDGYAYAAAP